MTPIDPPPGLLDKLAEAIEDGLAAESLPAPSGSDDTKGGE